MAAPNTNGIGYWIRNGGVLPAFALGKVAGTAGFGYWMRNGTLMYPAAIQSAAATYQPLVMVV